MIEALIKVPKEKFSEVRKILIKYGVDITEILDAYDINSYEKLDSFRLRNIEGIVSIGGDALADTEAPFD